jgi:ArsR family transcriptional regulator
MVSYRGVSQEELLEKAEILKVLGHPERLAIVLLTIDRELSVKELVEALKISQPKVSQHVGIMKELGLLSHRKEGTKTLYKVKESLVKELVELLFRSN